MNQTIAIVFGCAFFIRVISGIISSRNEKRLRAEGAVEYGKKNTLILALLHLTFYFGSLTEGIVRKTSYDQTTTIGIAILAASLVALFWVIKQLSPIWTVKLLIAKQHDLNTSPLFRILRHPNYFLNVIPELIGITLLFKSWTVAIIVAPLYAISLILRIREEERVMKAQVPGYDKLA